MNRIKTVLILLSTLLLVACSTPLGAEEWTFEEPAQRSKEHPNCPQPSEFGENGADLDFVLYRHIACLRGENENIIISPAAIRLALSEILPELDREEALRLAEYLGYSDLTSVQHWANQYREALLDRRPRSSARRYEWGWYEYALEDLTRERLFQAVGVEFFSIECNGSTRRAEQCQWIPQNERWSGTTLESEVLNNTTVRQFPPTQAMILRGQFEHHYDRSYQRPPRWPFKNGNDEDLLVHSRNSRVSRIAIAEEIHLMEWRIVGGEISIFLLYSDSLSSSEIEARLSREMIDEFLAILEDGYQQSATIPVFNVTNTIDLSSPLDISIDLYSTTSATLDYRGLNSPKTIDLIDLETVPQRGLLPRIDHPTTRPYLFTTPFIYFVYDHPTDSLLLLGRISNPGE